MSNSKVFKGVIWASVQRFGTMVISFVTNIVLARLLTPDDFGTIGMLLLFLAIANTFVDSGFGSALIQKQDANQDDFSTVFFINLGLSVVVYSILFFGAPWVARFYNVGILRPLLRAQGLVLILHAFSIIQTALLRKRMDFRKLSVCNLIGNIIGSIVGIGAALMGYGVWSLVIRTLTVGFVSSLLLWVIGRWKPILVFSIQSFKELFGFGGFMLLSSLVYTFTNNIQTLVIGKLFNAGILGNYTQARQLRNVATDSVSSVISQVFYPDFANNQDENSALSTKLSFGVQTISYIVVAIMSLCILISKPLILLLYGTKWEPCIPYFKILCVAGLFLSLQDININIIAAKGKSRQLFYFNVAKLLVFVCFMYLGAKIGGIFGLIWGINVYTCVAWLVFAYISTSLLSQSIWEQLFTVFKNVLLAIAPFFIVMFANRLIFDSLSSLLVIIVDSVLFMSIFLGISWSTHNTVLLYLFKRIVTFKNSHG